MHLFYDPEISGDFHALDKEESFHCIRVLRLKKSDMVFLTNGRGDLYKTLIEEPNPAKCLLKVIEKTEYHQPRPFRLHIAIAPTKQIERFEWFLEKATESGIEEITPLICEHSERKVLKPMRLSRVLVSAMKQSLKTSLPVLHNPETFQEFIKIPRPGLKFLANCMEHTVFLSDAYQPGEDTIILIGPEGDFSQSELEQATEAGYQSISLGSGRLRTETAGLSACIVMNALNRC